MARPLAEYFGTVEAQDVADYGFGLQRDYLEYETNKKWDWIVSNPPFKLAEQFILKALKQSRVGCAFLVRTTFVESVGRYKRLFEICPPAKVAQFVERVPMVKGRLDRKASTATGYCWLVWTHDNTKSSEMVWIPPCRKTLEFDEDYPDSTRRSI